MTLKYYHTLSALDQETAQQQLDLITSPPEDNKYTTLKQRLTETFGLGKCERASRLLHYLQLGDSKPSVLMAEMLALLGDHPPVSFLNNYSSNVSRRKFGYNLSAGIKTEDMRELAKKADTLWASKDMGVALTAHAVHRTSKQKQPKTTLPDSDQLCFYHRTFGGAAWKCKQPCTWSGNDTASR